MCCFLFFINLALPLYSTCWLGCYRGGQLCGCLKPTKFKLRIYSTSRLYLKMRDSVRPEKINFGQTIHDRTFPVPASTTINASTLHTQQRRENISFFSLLQKQSTNFIFFPVLLMRQNMCIVGLYVYAGY